MKKIITVAAIVLLALIMLRYYAKGKSPLKNALTGILSGVGALVVTSLLFAGFGKSFCLNYQTLAVSAVTGVPGVAAMAVINLIWKI